MSEKPILFSTEMVRAITAGRKTQTRRVIKPLPDKEMDFRGYVIAGGNKKDIGAAYFSDRLVPCQKSIYIKPPYEKGDVLWVRETWRLNDPIGDIARGTRQAKLRFKADEQNYTYIPIEEDTKLHKKWRPSIFMPRKVARIFLKVKDVRVERLNEVSEEDAISEGLKVFEKGFVFPGTEYDEIGLCHTHASIAFSKGWNQINEKRGYGWDTNPYVWVIEFERITSSDHIN